MATKNVQPSFLTNYQKVDLDPTTVVYHYNVNVTRSDNLQAAVQRELKVHRTIKVDLVAQMAKANGIEYYLYDDDLILYVPKKLTTNVVESELQVQDRTYTVRLSFIKEINLNNLNSSESSSAVTVVNLAFRNQLTRNNRYFLAKKGLYDVADQGKPLGDGLVYKFGFYQSIKTSQMGWVQVTDFSACAFFKPNQLLNYLAETGCNIRSNSQLDGKTWSQVNTLLKGINFVTTHNPENKKLYKAVGISHEAADERTFTYNNEQRTVAEHFEKEYFKLKFPKLPCVLVGTAAYPLEVCNIPPNQVYFKTLEAKLKAAFTRVSILKPDDRLDRIRQIIQKVHDGYDRGFLQSFGIKIPAKPYDLVTVPEKILKSRSVIYLDPNQKNKQWKELVQNGQWRMRNKRLLKISPLTNWAIVYMFADEDQEYHEDVTADFEGKLLEVQRKIGMINPGKESVPKIFEYPDKSVNEAFELILAQHQFNLIMFVINDEHSYQQIKQLADKRHGVLTQCVNYSKLLDQLDSQNPNKLATYCENICLKINAKLGGKNQGVDLCDLSNIELDDKKEPVMFLGADVTHFRGSTGKRSVAALVGSKDLAFQQYCCSLSEQANEDEKKESQEWILDMERMAHDLINKFILNNRNIRPTRIIYFRDGVDSGQVQKLLDEEIPAIRKACARLGFKKQPTITLILVVKRHHSRFFPLGSKNKSGNIPSGSYVDSVVTSPDRMEFYLCSQDAFLGTAKGANYQVILDENGLTLNDIINLSYDMCHLYVSSTKAVSLPAPLYYAHLAAFRGRLYEEDNEDTEADPDGEEREHVLSRLIKINENLEESMFFI